MSPRCYLLMAGQKEETSPWCCKVFSQTILIPSANETSFRTVKVFCIKSSPPCYTAEVVPLGLCHQLQREKLTVGIFYSYVPVAMWIVLNNCTSTDIFNVEQGNILHGRLPTDLLASFNSHHSVFDRRYTCVPSFPSARLQSHCWGWHGYHVAQLV